MFDAEPISTEVSARPGVAARAGGRAVAVVVAALAMALSAQVAVPVPFSPVPMTLQPLAVLVIGGVLGSAAGAAALVLYLAMGLVGLPVFSGGGAGLAWLLGPTGGYLLAFPVAAAVTGWIATHPAGAIDGGSGSLGIARLLLACAVGMAVIHAGGVAQLALLGGDPALAFRVGFVPFFTGDLLKIGLAAAVILLAPAKLRSLR